MQVAGGAQSEGRHGRGIRCWLAGDRERRALFHRDEGRREEQAVGTLRAAGNIEGSQDIQQQKGRCINTMFFELMNE